jgi:endoglucanase
VLNLCFLGGDHRSFNSYIDYPTRGQSYEIQHDEFHNTDTPNKFLAYGALVGGPNADDT